jgi:biopolymer transport protein ExbB
MSMSWLSLIEQGGISLFPLGLCSILVVAVILERMWTFSRIGKVPQELIKRVETLLASGDWHSALQLLEDSSSPFARLVKATVMRKNASPAEITDILTLGCDAEVADAMRPLPVLGTIGNVAPFIGLFGTVIGIMKAFHEVAQKEAAGASIVSQGISEALIATAAGLAIGILSVVANNWCNAWVEDYRLRLERFSTEWSYRLQELRGAPAPEESVA